jgi:hypothetical protein
MLTRFMTRVTRRVPHVELELLNLSQNLSSTLVFIGAIVPWKLFSTPR